MQYSLPKEVPKGRSSRLSLPQKGAGMVRLSVRRWCSAYRLAFCIPTKDPSDPLWSPVGLSLQRRPLRLMSRPKHHIHSRHSFRSRHSFLRSHHSHKGRSSHSRSSLRSRSSRYNLPRCIDEGTQGSSEAPKKGNSVSSPNYRSQ